MTAIPNKILVRGVNWLGDAVMTTPALLRLREALPGAHISLLTPSKLADLWSEHPAIDAVEIFEKGERVWSVGARLRRLKFDTALVLPNSPRSALDAWFAGIPRRVGGSSPWRNIFLTEAVAARPGHLAMHKRTAGEINRLIQTGFVKENIPAGAHHIHQYLHLAAALGANPAPLPPRLGVSGEAVSRIKERLGMSHDNHVQPVWIGLNPGAEYGPAKRWPEDRFAETAIRVQRQIPCRWMIFGLLSDAEMAGRIAAKINQAAGSDHAAINLAGETTLGELCAALSLCRVLLTNDSGPMHVAAALGTKVVVPFGSTSPELTGPGLPGDSRHRLLRAGAPCSPCFLRECPIDFRCMNNIQVDEVVRAVVESAK